MIHQIVEIQISKASQKKITAVFVHNKYLIIFIEYIYTY